MTDTLDAKLGQDAPLEQFLAGALPPANAEDGATAWLALKFGPSMFGVFDAFTDEAGRDAHLNGQIAAALMANASALLSTTPNIEKVDLLAAKLRAKIRIAGITLIWDSISHNGSPIVEAER